MSLSAIVETYATPELVTVPIDEANSVKMRQLATYGDSKAHEAEREKMAAKWSEGKGLPPGMEAIADTLKKKPRAASIEDARAAFDLHKLMAEPECTLPEAFDLVLRAPRIVELIFRVSAIQSTRRTAELFEEEFASAKKG